MKIELPISKSIAIRELFIRSLLGQDISYIERYKSRLNDDILSAYNALNQYDTTDTLFMGGSATALRFMVAYAAVTLQSKVIDCNEQLRHRPIAPLVDALRSLGADIEYLNEQGYAPVRVNGKQLSGGEVEVDASISSQFVSALMIAESGMRGDLSIVLSGNVASAEYILLTQKILKKYGARVEFDYDKILCHRALFSNIEPTIETDVSSAIPFFAYLAMKKEGDLFLSGLNLVSAQPDVEAVQFFEMLGVEYEQVEAGLHIWYEPKQAISYIEYESDSTPDSAMLILATCCVREIKCKICGAGNLVYKESDRIKSVVEALGSCGYEVSQIFNCLLYNKIHHKKEGKIVINTYNDHRVVMLGALLSLFYDVELSEYESVRKSFPNFWNYFNELKNGSNAN